MRKPMLKFAGQLLPASWIPTHYCGHAVDGISEGEHVMLIEDIAKKYVDGLVVYAYQPSKFRIKLSFHTEFYSYFLPIIDKED